MWPRRKNYYVFFFKHEWIRSVLALAHGKQCPLVECHFYKNERCNKPVPTEGGGDGAKARAPDCLASYACAPGSSPAVPMWGFSEKQYCFCLFNVTRRSRWWRPRRVKVETSVSTLISRRSLRCALLTPVPTDMTIFNPSMGSLLSPARYNIFLSVNWLFFL